MLWHCSLLFPFCLLKFCSDEDYLVDDLDTYSLDRKISLPLEIANKYKRFIELTDVHHAITFKDYAEKSDEEKELILDMCQEEVENLFDEAYVWLFIILSFIWFYNLVVISVRFQSQWKLLTVINWALQLLMI